MAESTGPTPRVTFTLDNSEIMRLSKLRATLKLAHWSKIGGTYELEVNENVAKSIRSLELTDQVAYEKRYSSWFNRYSDFQLSWTKSKHCQGVWDLYKVAFNRWQLSCETDRNFFSGFNSWPLLTSGVTEISCR